MAGVAREDGRKRPVVPPVSVSHFGDALHGLETCISARSPPARPWLSTCRDDRVHDREGGAASPPLYRALQDCGLGGRHRLGRAHMHPYAFEPQPMEPLRLGGAIEQGGQRKGAGRRIAEQRGRQDGGARIDERHHVALAAATRRPSGVIA